MVLRFLQRDLAVLHKRPIVGQAQNELSTNHRAKLSAQLRFFSVSATHQPDEAPIRSKALMVLRYAPEVSNEDGKCDRRKDTGREVSYRSVRGLFYVCKYSNSLFAFFSYEPLGPPLVKHNFLTTLAPWSGTSEPPVDIIPTPSLLVHSPPKHLTVSFRFGHIDICRIDVAGRFWG